MRSVGGHSRAYFKSTRQLIAYHASIMCANARECGERKYEKRTEEEGQFGAILER